ncbi:Purine-cytosine permease fcyB [Hyphodiscus hymeniophilus]|uniref:Purine-cytosine permease fcyB n=1 Tax=Hyphodiscus hymeniophilus TaxID=353542 RepID=A0A9P7AZM1_9HELO|nr:Purine-cytosine permease fcyB [Hyphodiscus hymeniophilus]
MTSAKEQAQHLDLEKVFEPSTLPGTAVVTPTDTVRSNADVLSEPGEVLPSNNKWLLFSSRIEQVLGLESRGIHRVKSHEQTAETTLSFMQILVIFAWLPQFAVLLILFGTAGPKFDVYWQSVGDSATIAGHRISFFSVCLSSAVTYAPSAADYTVYCDPRIVSRWKAFWAVLLGLTLSFVATFVLGVGLASGLQNDPLWAAAGAGSGALVVAGFDSLGNFVKFCSVIVALGLISNMVPEIYSSGINFQILGRYPAIVPRPGYRPRFVWNTIGLFVVAVCALAGRNHLAQIFTNFLALMGYWISIWIAITLEDQFIFRRRMRPEYIWSDWDKQEKLPIGLAALAAFCIGWAGAVLCMAQFYFVGPLAKLIGRDGGDMGTYVGFCMAGIVYPPLRYWELKKFGR